MRWKLVLAQWETVEGDPAANLARAGELMRGRGRGADVVVFPELWTTGYAADLPALAEAGGRRSLAQVRALARAAGANLVAGSLVLPGRGGLYNTACAIDRHGRVVARYRKVHLCTPLGEEALFLPGKGARTFELDGVTCGLLICYDLRFPELSRLLVLAGARVLFYPARWPARRLAHWRALLVARAIENQCFVVGVNSVGVRGDLGGGSLVVDPWGEVLAEGGSFEEILEVEIDLARVAEVRAYFPALADRAPVAYRPRGASRAPARGGATQPSTE